MDCEYPNNFKALSLLALSNGRAFLFPTYRPKYIKAEILPYDDCDIEIMPRFPRFSKEKKGELSHETRNPVLVQSPKGRLRIHDRWETKIQDSCIPKGSSYFPLENSMFKVVRRTKDLYAINCRITFFPRVVMGTQPVGAGDFF